MVAAADWTALGTLVRLVVTEDAALPSARHLLEADLAALDAACSRFRPDSEVCALARAEGQPVRVSPLLAEALAVALDAARLTDGDVDPTVGNALVGLGYDRDFDDLVDGLVVRAPVAGWQQVELDRARRMVTVPPGVLLDLGATAKAWAADRAATRISAVLGTGVLVSLGGDIRVAGPVPDGGWQIRVQDRVGRPQDTPTAPTTTISLHGGGLASSSTRARRWVRDGVELHHVVDPRLGFPAWTPWRTVSVAARTATLANTASTAAVIRAERAPAYLTGLGVTARLVARDGRTTLVGGWPAQEVAA
ncbi:MAG: FAD:protein FMN transferase [Actinobacteria bacterium]|nr:FAD:protein FMN transferase [Actinomycetota bacterium]MCG2800275.1 FAD:protein FMN transferase [Cellulomonas sp.]